MFEEYDVVRLKAPLPEAAVPVGAKGTVLMVYTHPRLAYEVEFVSKVGKSFGTFTLEQGQIEEWQQLTEMGRTDA